MLAATFRIAEEGIVPEADALAQVICKKLGVPRI